MSCGEDSLGVSYGFKNSSIGSRLVLIDYGGGLAPFPGVSQSR